jgi:hypothetical protein
MYLIIKVPYQNWWKFLSPISLLGVFVVHNYVQYLTFTMLAGWKCTQSITFLPSIQLFFMIFAWNSRNASSSLIHIAWTLNVQIGITNKQTSKHQSWPSFIVQCEWIFHSYFKEGKVQLVTFTVQCGFIFHPDFQRRESSVDPVTAAPAGNLCPLKGVCNKSTVAYNRW